MNNRFIWLDLEMTGLDVDKHAIVEIATVVTDDKFKVIAEGPNLVIHQPTHVLAQTTPIAKKMHEKSGLWEAIKTSEVSLEEAGAETLAFLKKYVAPNSSPMCGNTISQDRRFLAKYLPELEAFFHYRHLDVSSFKIVYNAMYPHAKDFYYTKSGNHRAKEDTLESIAELKFYLEHMCVASQ